MIGQRQREGALASPAAHTFNAMISITVKGLAKFMTASPAQQRKVVRDFKYPKLDESAAQQKYYREARMIITAYHKAGHPAEWLLQKVAQLQRLAQQRHNPRIRTRLNHNARAVRLYHQYFRKNEFEVVQRKSLQFDSGNVRVRTTPDLCVIENGAEKIIKFEFSAAEPSGDVIKIISQVMYESVNRGGATLPAASIMYYDVPRGAAHKGARVQTRTLANILAACETIENIWEAI
jgi:hypothetical protein